MHSQSRFLSKAELRQVTGKVHRDLQKIRLAQMNIPFLVNPDDDLIVEWSTESLARQEKNHDKIKPMFDRVPDGSRRGKRRPDR